MQKQATKTTSKVGKDIQLSRSKQSGQKSLKERHNEILKNMMDANIMKPTNVEAQRILKICD